ASCLCQHLFRRVDSDNLGVEANRESFRKASRATTQVEDRPDALIFHVCRDHVHPKIEKLRPMIATAVVGRGYVSCVVVHISKGAAQDDSLLTRADRVDRARRLSTIQNLER